jgi:hypothetical protein
MAEGISSTRSVRWSRRGARVTLRTLGRATLARQLLLTRDRKLTRFEAIEHLVGDLSLPDPLRAGRAHNQRADAWFDS